MKLRVLLFNYIPLAVDDQQQTLVARIESEFETLHTHIDLEVRPISYEYDLYDIEQLRRLFTEYDLIELDVTIMQEWLIRESLISPFRALPDRSWHSAALESIRVNEDVYGVPSWLCSHFVISQAGTITPRLNLADNIMKHNAATIYDFSGSWSKLGLYLDGILDEHNDITLSNVNEFNGLTIGNMTHMLLACSEGLCLKGNFSDPGFSAKTFQSITSKTPILIGYFESILHSLKKIGVAGQNYDIDTLRLSRQQCPPILFVDAWVKSSQCNNEACNEMAHLFTDYITSEKTQSWIIASGDQQGTNITPRYLIPANNETLSALNKNLYPIRQAYSLLETAKPLPKEVSFELGSHKKYYACMVDSKIGLLDSNECIQHKAPNTPTGKQLIKSGTPSLMVGIASGFSDSFVTRFWGREYGERANTAASAIAMSAVGYSSPNIATFIGMQFALQWAGLPKKYASYLSWTLMLFSLMMDLNPQAMLVNILVGMFANFCGDQVGRTIGRVSSNYATFFFNSQRVDHQMEQVEQRAMRPHMD